MGREWVDGVCLEGAGLKVTVLGVIRSIGA